MQSLVYTTSKCDEDLLGILELQRKNHSANLSAEAIFSQGFGMSWKTIAADSAHLME